MTYPQRLLTSFEQLSKLVLSQESMRSTLDLVSRLAVSTIPGCDVASVSLVAPAGFSTAGSSDPLAVQLDAVQYETNQGPCLDAIGERSSWFQIDEMSSDETWPRFAASAAQHGFESLLAVTLRLDGDTDGALNLYGRDARAFTHEDREFAAIYAAHASVALVKARAALEAPDDQKHGVTSREIIERAIGILMEAEFRSADEALEVLQERAEELHVRLRDSAQDVIESAGERREELQLPPGFYDRVMARAVGVEPSTARPARSRSLRIAALAGAGLVAASLWVGVRLNEAKQDESQLRTAITADLADNTAILLKGPSGETGKIVSSRGGSLLVAAGLAPPEDHHIYQLWLTRDDEVVAAKVFEPDEGVAVVWLNYPPGSFEEARVTLESEAGAPQLSNDVVLQSP